VETAYENGSGGFGIAISVSVTLTVRSCCSISIWYKSSTARHDKAPQYTVDDGHILLSSINRERSFVRERKAKNVRGPPEALSYLSARGCYCTSTLKLQAERNNKKAVVNSSFCFISTMDANINYWTIGSIVIGFLLVLPSIMGLFSKSKFDVKGKVCIGHPVVAQPRLTTSKTVLLTGAS
jgi:hypothetical protein